VGTGTLYRHFPTREALAEAVYHGEVATLCDRARELQATLPAAEALAAFLRGMVDHIHAHQGLARTLAMLMADRSGVRAKGGRALEQAVTDLVATAVQEGAVRDDVGAGAVMMALHGIGAAHDRPDWRAEADGVITLVLDGLRRRHLVQAESATPVKSEDVCESDEGAAEPAFRLGFGDSGDQVVTDRASVVLASEGADLGEHVLQQEPHVDLLADPDRMVRTGQVGAVRAEAGSGSDAQVSARGEEHQRDGR
jgi:AcrR family transcriptional regulator